MHWYALSKATGMATLCASELDARRVAKEADNLYPRSGPHVATRLAPIDEGLLAAAIITLTDNAHLADGEVCTLIHLKRAVSQVLGGEKALDMFFRGSAESGGREE